MKNDKATKGKQLTREDSYYIETALDTEWTLNELAKKFEKNSTTISKEIKRNHIMSASAVIVHWDAIFQNNITD